MRSPASCNKFKLPENAWNADLQVTEKLYFLIRNECKDMDNAPLEVTGKRTESPLTI